MALFITIVCATVAIVKQTPAPARAGPGVSSRRLFTSALVSSAALGLAAPDARAYRTVQQAMEDTRQVSQESALYAQFAVLQGRMKQLDEFVEMADKAEWDNLQAFSRNFNRVVQNGDMLKIVEMLPTGPSKEDAKKYAGLVLNDLKAIDRAAREKKGDTIKEVVGKLRGNLDAFISLRPDDVKQKFAVPDL